MVRESVGKNIKFINKNICYTNAFSQRNISTSPSHIKAKCYMALVKWIRITITANVCVHWTHYLLTRTSENWRCSEKSDRCQIGTFEPPMASQKYKSASDGRHWRKNRKKIKAIFFFPILNKKE